MDEFRVVCNEALKRLNPKEFKSWLCTVYGSLEERDFSEKTKNRKIKLFREFIEEVENEKTDKN